MARTHTRARETRARAFIRAIKNGHHGQAGITGGLATSQRNALRVYLFRVARTLTRIIREGKRAILEFCTYVLTINKKIYVFISTIYKKSTLQSCEG